MNAKRPRPLKPVTQIRLSSPIRRGIRPPLTALGDFSFNDGEAVNDEEIDALSNLLCAFHTGRETRARFATLVQIERVKKAMPEVLGHHIPAVVNRNFESDSARNLIDYDLRIFLISITQLHNTRAQLSASGRGAFGRETVAQLREKMALVEAERDAALAALSQAQPTATQQPTESLEEPKDEEEEQAQALTELPLHFSDPAIVAEARDALRDWLGDIKIEPSGIGLLARWRLSEGELLLAAGPRVAKLVAGVTSSAS